MPTLTMSVGRDISEHVLPPRTAFLDYPMGNEIGRPGRRDEQLAILRAAFASLEGMKAPGTIVDLGFELDGQGPEGQPWREWVYTKPFRRYHMKTREGGRPE